MDNSNNTYSIIDELLSVAVEKKKEFDLELDINNIKLQLSNLAQVVFEVTNSCNLKCKYCGYGEFYSNYDKRDNHNMKFIQAKNLLEYLSQYWNSTVDLTIKRKRILGFYGGEPLLNMPLIGQIIQISKKMQNSMNTFGYNITTNGVLLDRYMEYLVENEFSLFISLDGNRLNHSYRITHSGINSFERVFSNVKIWESTHNIRINEYWY
jgi:uncharacterized protein